MSTEAVTPIIDTETKLQTASNVTTASTTANVKVQSAQFQLTALTNGCYVRLGPADVTVSAVNGVHIPVGHPVRWQTSAGADHLAYIRDGASDGALSINWLNSD